MKIFDYIKQEEFECEIIECDIKIENYSDNLYWTLSKAKEDTCDIGWCDRKERFNGKDIINIWIALYSGLSTTRRIFSSDER